MAEISKKENSLILKLKYKWSNQPLFSTAIALVIIIVAQTLVLGFDYDSFGSWFISWLNNWVNILRNNASIGIIALGMTLVIISGGIDLAVGST
jgi:ribose transport system permease protein